ncbi:MAG: 50S ribosomal protein L25/general stress protein Ctc [Desulfobacterales bacterium]|nr:50S ribosomal protein L25/general stress protein Ctc [Desulfobacterales bacterium]
MDLIELNVKTREGKGKGVARKLRAANQIPAIVYGKKIDPVMVSVDIAAFDKIIRDNGTTGLFLDLKVEDNGGKRRVVMVKDIQMDVFGREYRHVDFQEIDMDTQVTVTVPVEIVGTAAGVKEGGMLQIIRRELDVLCKPEHAPEKIDVDVSALEIGESLHVESLDLDDTIEIPHELDFTIVTVVPPAASESEEGEEEEGEEGETAEA